MAFSCSKKEEDLWMELNDLSDAQCMFTNKQPRFPPCETHLVMWEKVSADQKVPAADVRSRVKDQSTVTGDQRVPTTDQQFAEIPIEYNTPNSFSTNMSPSKCGSSHIRNYVSNENPRAGILSTVNRTVSFVPNETIVVQATKDGEQTVIDLRNCVIKPTGKKHVIRLVVENKQNGNKVVSGQTVTQTGFPANQIVANNALADNSGELPHTHTEVDSNIAGIVREGPDSHIPNLDLDNSNAFTPGSHIPTVQNVTNSSSFPSDFIVNDGFESFTKLLGEDLDVSQPYTTFQTNTALENNEIQPLENSQNRKASKNSRKQSEPIGCTGHVENESTTGHVEKEPTSGACVSHLEPYLTVKPKAKKKSNTSRRPRKTAAQDLEFMDLTSLMLPVASSAAIASKKINAQSQGSGRKRKTNSVKRERSQRSAATTPQQVVSGVVQNASSQKSSVKRKRAQTEPFDVKKLKGIAQVSCDNSNVKSHQDNALLQKVGRYDRAAVCTRNETRSNNLHDVAEQAAANKMKLQVNLNGRGNHIKDTVVQAPFGAELNKHRRCNSMPENQDHVKNSMSCAGVVSMTTKNPAKRGLIAPVPKPVLQNGKPVVFNYKELVESLKSKQVSDKEQLEMLRQKLFTNNSQSVVSNKSSTSRSFFGLPLKNVQQKGCHSFSSAIKSSILTSPQTGGSTQKFESYCPLKARIAKSPAKKKRTGLANLSRSPRRKSPKKAKKISFAEGPATDLEAHHAQFQAARNLSDFENSTHGAGVSSGMSSHMRAVSGDVPGYNSRINCPPVVDGGYSNGMSAINYSNGEATNHNAVTQQDRSSRFITSETSGVTCDNSTNISDVIASSLDDLYEDKIMAAMGELCQTLDIAPITSLNEHSISPSKQGRPSEGLSPNIKDSPSAMLRSNADDFDLASFLFDA